MLLRSFIQQFQSFNFLLSILYLCQKLSITNPGDGAIVGKAIVNTIIGGSGGGLAVLFYNKAFGGKKWSYLLTLNGALAGMISMCAGCDAYMPWSSLLIGTMGGFMFLIVGKAMNR